MCYGYACVWLFVPVCVEMPLYLLTMSGCCEQSHVCSVLDSTDVDLDWLWTSSPDALFPLPLSSLHPPDGRYGPAKHTAVHLATWVELRVFYEWHSQPYTPKTLTVMCLMSMEDTEWVSLCEASVFWCYSFYSVGSLSVLGCAFLSLMFIWTSRTQCGCFAIHHLLYSLEINLIYLKRKNSRFQV